MKSGMVDREEFTRTRRAMQEKRLIQLRKRLASLEESKGRRHFPVGGYPGVEISESRDGPWKPCEEPIRVLSRDDEWMHWRCQRLRTEIEDLERELSG